MVGWVWTISVSGLFCQDFFRVWAFFLLFFPFFFTASLFNDIIVQLLSLSSTNYLQPPLIFWATSLRSIKSLAPLLDRILVQRIKAEAKTASGIYLPESTVEKLSEAKVLAVGPGGTDKEGKRIEVSVKPGDRVLIPQYGGSPVKVGDEEYHLFRDHELLAKINE
ncbi:chaperonin 10-like protein [Tuber brumale]|nr:chaperonin 10-like protein [Tuber brumale]